MHVFVVMEEGCDECDGIGAIGVYSTESAAKAASTSTDRIHYSWVEEMLVQEEYVSRMEQLRAFRIADGRNPDTGLRK